MTKIAFATGSRADYSIVRRYLNLLNIDSSIDLKILATGALLNNIYGHQIDLIYKDGFDVAAKIEIKLDSSSNASVVCSMAEALKKFACYFKQYKYDLLIILGDRYEMFSVAVAAAMQNQPILHIHGGEATYGNYDEFIRHCITKMSVYHFTSAEEYRKRVIQLGEDPDRVFCLGALGAENCLYIEEKNVPFEIRRLKDELYFVILFHPETLTNVDVFSQVTMLLNALDEYDDYKLIFLGSNADTLSHVIRKMVQEYVKNRRNAMYFENLHTDAYHYLLKNSVCLIGNSSSGLIEAPSLGICTVNIGDRQKGRVRGNSVIDVMCDEIEIKRAIEKVIKERCKIEPINPYYKENTAELYYNTTKKLIMQIGGKKNEPKKFYDMIW